MPKTEIDYSNTIFYKIYCKDTNIKDLYVGLTTNFVQRKHTHKQSCNNEKAMNHNCKLYKVIRSAGGWDNWQMEIIAFHNCKDSHEAHKKEQEYFETLGATLNSIEPLPKPKPTDKIIKIVKEKTIMYCEPCNIHFSCRKAQETHNNTNKHHKMSSTIPIKFYCDKCDYKCSSEGDFNKHLQSKKHNTTESSHKNYKKYICEKCNYNTVRNSQYCRHLATAKHIRLTDANGKVQNSSSHICLCGNEYKHVSSLCKHKRTCNNDGLGPRNEKQYKCNCGNQYRFRQGLFTHKKTCSGIAHNITTVIDSSYSETSVIIKDNFIVELLKQNQDFKNLMIEQSKQITELMKMNGNMTNNTIQ